jgi:site-specific recombinase XerD
MIGDMRIRNFTEATQTSYCQYVSQFARHFRQSPERLGPEDIRTYQHHLVHERKLSTSSLFVAVGALRFLYKVTLKRDWPIETIIPTPKRQTKLPVLLSQDEVCRLLDAVTMYKHRVILTTCYAAGLRISEAIRLTPLAIDSERMTIRIDQGRAGRIAM